MAGIDDHRGRCGINGTILGESGEEKERYGMLARELVLVGNHSR